MPLKKGQKKKQMPQGGTMQRKKDGKKKRPYGK